MKSSVSFLFQAICLGLATTCGMAQARIKLPSDTRQDEAPAQVPAPDTLRPLLSGSRKAADVNADIPDIDIPVNSDPLFKSVSLGFQNDKIFATDQDFTTELDFQVITKLWEIKLPHIGFDRNTGYKLKPGMVVESRNFQKLATTIGYYTPSKEDLANPDPIHTTRPYASLQALDIGRISERLIYNYQAEKFYYTNINSVLTLGLTGSPAAQNLQYWFHDKISKGSVNPEGWHNQIGGMTNQLIVNYQLGYRFLFYYSRLGETTRFGYEDGVPLEEAGTFQWINSIGGLKLNIGNWRIDVTASGRFNFLNINMAEQYFCGYDNGNFVSFPGGMIASKKAKNGKKPIEILHGQFPVNYTDLEYPVDLIPREKIVFEQDSSRVNEEMAIPGVVKKLNDRIEFIDDLREVANQKSRKESGKPERLKLYNAPFSFHTFAEIELKCVAHDGSLQGVLLYNKNTNPTYLRLIHPFQAMVSLGAQARWMAFVLDVGAALRTREYYAHESYFRDPDGNPYKVEPLGNFFHKWGFIRLSFHPSFVYERNKYKSIAARSATAR